MDCVTMLNSLMDDQLCSPVKHYIAISIKVCYRVGLGPLVPLTLPMRVGISYWVENRARLGIGAIHSNQVHPIQ